MRYFEAHRGVARLCQLRSVLVKRSRRLETYEGLLKVLSPSEVSGEKEEWDEEEDDPWGDDNDNDNDNDVLEPAIVSISPFHVLNPAECVSDKWRAFVETILR